MNIKLILVIAIYFLICDFINQYIHKKINEKKGKKAFYNCSKCKAFDCPAKFCDKQSKELVNPYEIINK